MSASKGAELIRRGLSNQGWSLVELLVALAIMAILAATALPAYQESVRKARRAEGRSALMEAMQREERYYSQNGVYAVFDRSQPNGYKWHSAERPEKSAYELRASPCAGASLAECIVVTAHAGTPAVNDGYRDPVCGDLSLSSNGSKTPMRMDCW